MPRVTLSCLTCDLSVLRCKGSESQSPSSISTKVVNVKSLSEAESVPRFYGNTPSIKQSEGSASSRSNVPGKTSSCVSVGTGPTRLANERATFTIGGKAPRPLEGVNKDSSLPHPVHPVPIPLNAPSRRPTFPMSGHAVNPVGMIPSIEQAGHRPLPRRRSTLMGALVGMGSSRDQEISEPQRLIKTLDENLALLRAATMIAIPPSRIEVLRFLKQILGPGQYEVFSRSATS